MKLSADRRDQAFRNALTWDQFLRSMTVNRTEAEASYSRFGLTPADKAFLQGLPGVTDVLVLAHDWCGDVVANLPLFARIESETGKLRLHIIPKDPDNLDIAALYPHPDGDIHIPIYVFFDSQGREKGHFIERTPEITDLVGRWILEFWAANPRREGRGQPFSALTPEVRKALLEKLTTERTKVFDLEKASVLRVLGKLLA